MRHLGFVPEISRFFGVVVAMYYHDHPPPHFHVRYGQFDGVFAPLRDPTVFAQVRIHPELGTVVWPTGADLDPDVLYAELSGTPIPFPTAPSRDRR